MKQELENAVKEAYTALYAAQAALEAWHSLPENNVYPSLKEACVDIENKLLNKACEDCEGSYNIGLEQYTQKFFVNTPESSSIQYEGKLSVEYNRHDKQYYYVDGSTFTFEEITNV